MLEVFGDMKSGNCLKVKWALDWLGMPYRWVEVDIMAGGSRTPQFLAMNTAGQVPTVRFEDGRSLAQSNAIVLHLLERTDFVPTDAFGRAKMFEWLFWEQYSHEPQIAVRRFQKLYLGRTDAEIDSGLLSKGTAVLERMDRHLASQPFLVGERPCVADLCLLPYTRSAPEGGFDLEPLPTLRAWIERTAAAFRISAATDGRAAWAGANATS